MSARLTRTFRAAVRYAIATVEVVSAEAGYARITFDGYLNRTRPSTKAAYELAGALEARAEKLIKHATRLREAADEAGGSDGSV